ncbi:MAG: hypothetical protein A3I38_02490 [Candidatus Wildermuthbacteria bacterium RIFCSPLOWO2_02_FULL_47_10]|nr:MAG: hypothetical protein A3I38_02490 [Candidatus Wildermuthbacteria bacterium RIFCSPLOWO2_02_FULL_47_10]
MIDFLLPPEIPIFEPNRDPHDLKLRNIIHPWKGDKPGGRIDVGILGIPFDLGVKRSGGRTGAARAPDAIRRQIKKYGTAYNCVYGADLSSLNIIDFGNVDVIPAGVAATHSRARNVVQTLFGLCDTLIIIGGGNDLSFATISGLRRAFGEPIGGMNVDAHLDVREVAKGNITSGTPYRLLLERGVLLGENLFEVGAQGHVNSKSHWGWAEEKGIHICPLQMVKTIGVDMLIKCFRRRMTCLIASFISVDIDAVAQAFAPGSSAPNPDGFSAAEILAISYLAGEIPNLRLFEIMEVNPEFDQDNRTSRLSVNIITDFLAGCAIRKQKTGH